MKNISVFVLQKMLKAAGGKTISTDGIMGPQTRGAIDDLNVPDWLKIAMKEIGTKEIRGSEHNPDVLRYHSYSAGKYSTDEVPWCGSFAAMCMAESKYDLPLYPERALSWLNFGRNADGPKIGSIAIKGRKGGGHVGFVISCDGDELYLLGGNQNDEVNIRKYKITDFIEFRVPMNYGNYYTRLEVSAGKAGREA